MTKVNGGRNRAEFTVNRLSKMYTEIFFLKLSFYILKILLGLSATVQCLISCYFVGSADYFCVAVCVCVNLVKINHCFYVKNSKAAPKLALQDCL